jgi:predicted peroxiredoxin|uniref:Multidrug transporter n=1 Tax=Desulfobacca acetoxidans TaxID=60893 RepID=A0A7V6DNW9_9BACT
MAPEKKEKMVFIATHGPEHPEKATFPFLMANAAQAMDIEAVVALQGVSVLLARKGCAEHVFAAGLTPLKQLLDSLLENGGRLLVCIPCLEERKIGKEDLIPQAELVKAGSLILEINSATSTLVY